tara:strand:+ start:105 stop:983 length:879 start_codon:yes stop_codon:yes gene_type:complete
MKAISFNSLGAYNPPDYNRFYFMHLPKSAGSRLTAKNNPGNHDEQTILPNGKTFKKLNHAFCIPEVMREPFNHDDYNSFKSKGKFFNYAFNFPYFKSEDTLVFSIIRNPFDMLCSYHHHYYDAGHNGWASCNNLHGFNNFEEFIRGYCSDEISGFNTLTKSNFSGWHMPIMHKFLFSQMFDANGKCHVDFLIRYENMVEGLKKMNERFGLTFDYDKYDTVFDNSWRSNQSKKNKNYREYYTPELIKLVEEKCSRELSLFGYDFEGPTDKNTFLDPSEIKYNPLTNQLISSDS